MQCVANGVPSNLDGSTKHLWSGIVDQAYTHFTRDFQRRLRVVERLKRYSKDSPGMNTVLVLQASLHLPKCWRLSNPAHPAIQPRLLNFFFEQCYAECCDLAPNKSA